MTALNLRYLRNTTFTVNVLFQGKWRAQILCVLRAGPIRLGELTRMIPASSKKMLTQNLRQLEADGIVVRRDMSDLVLHIEYELETTAREEVCALLDHLEKWGDLHQNKP